MLADDKERRTHSGSCERIKINLSSKRTASGEEGSMAAAVSQYLFLRLDLGKLIEVGSALFIQLHDGKPSRRLAGRPAGPLLTLIQLAPSTAARPLCVLMETRP